MGHFLSKNGYGLKKKTRTLHKKKKKKKKRRRNCFLRGPCMFCFIVHNPSGSIEDDWPFESEVSKLAERYASLNTPEECARFLLSPGELGALENQSRNLLSKLIGPSALFCSVVPDYSEMVCKRKSGDLERCAPSKQPRCAFQEGMENGGESQRQRPSILQLPSSSSSSTSSCCCQKEGSEEEKATENTDSSHQNEEASSTSSSCCDQEEHNKPSLRNQEASSAGEELKGNQLPSSSSSSSSSSSVGQRTNPKASFPSSPSSSSQVYHTEGSEEVKSTETTEASHVNQLPSSILLKVLSHLSVKERCLSVSLVCKYWRDLCLDFQFWKQIDLSGLQQVRDDLLLKIASRRQNVTEINISDCRNVQDHGVCSLASSCTGLVRYTAYRCKQLSDASLSAVAVHCPMLRKVHVGNQDKLTDHALRLLGDHCPELRDVHFGQCYSISDEGLVRLAQGCTKLQRIYMQENKLVTDRSVQAFAENCPDLQFVGFMGCSVTSQGVIHLTRLQQLSSLDLRHISELDNETVMEVVRKCTNLTSLNLCLNWTINDRCVEIIAKEGRRLKELYLVSCKITDHALMAIGQYSSSIETVDAGWCKEITDHGATGIASSSKSLRYLGLMRCDQVNEETVERLVLQYPHIVFSTVMQDCKRTLERAYQMGWCPNNT